MSSDKTQATYVKAIPVQPGERIAFVDIIRGFAVFGILVANMSSFSGHTIDIQSLPTGIDRAVNILIRFLIVAKFYSLFSFLFGWGMAIQMERAAAKGANFLPVYIRRLLILLGLGIIHGILIWDGDILTLYSLLGLILILFRKRSDKFLLFAIILCLLSSIILSAPGEVMGSFRSWYEDITSTLRKTNLPNSLYATGTYFQITQLRLQGYLHGLSRSLYSFGNVFAMFLLGLYVGKRRIFQEVDQHIPLIRKTLVLGLFIGFTFHGLWVWSSIHPGWLPLDWIPAEYSRMLQRAYYTIGAPAIMLFYVSVLILILRKVSVHDQLTPLGNVGRMALSNYLLQSIIATLIFYNYGLGLYNEISPAFGLILTIIIFLAQIKFSEWWFSRYKFGPAEWLWRMLTYLRWQPTHSGELIEGITPNPRFQTINRIYAKTGPYPLLAISWLFLIIWGALLVNYHFQLERRSNQALAQIVAGNSPSQQVNKPSQLVGVEQDALTNNDFVAIPKVKPVTYTPSQLAASGDVLALAATFDIDHALLEIETLTSDQFSGRSPGSPGGEAAGDYIADRFADFGLQPLGSDGTYFQPFAITYTPISTVPILTVQSGDGELYDKYKLYEDYSPIIKWYSGPGSGTAKVNWLVNCSDKNFAGINVVGKIVMCNPGNESNWLSEVSRNALENGAIALLLIADPSTHPPDMGSTIKDVWVPEPIPTFWIYPDVVKDILTGSDISAADIISTEIPIQIESTVSFDIQTTETATCPGKDCIARNILGILPGRDSNYSNEAIILGAHYDHLGQGPDGTVWGGANDNASGVAVLLEIARRWHDYGYVPRRTVIFAAWDAEEVGLVGSYYYVNNPKYPLQETIAMIQLDMVGAGGEILNIDGDQDLGNRIYQAAESYGVQTEFTSFGRSDHVPFMSAGVPASLLIWRDNESAIPIYHRPADTLKLIEPEKLKSAARIAELTALNIVESEPAILNMLEERASAAINGDLAAFLDTSQFDQHEIDHLWFSDFQSLNPIDLKLTPQEITFFDNIATVQVNYRIVYPSIENETITSTLNTQLSTKIEHDNNSWVWSGPNLTWVDEDISDHQFKVAHPPGISANLSNLDQSVYERYTEIATLLGLQAEVEAKLLLYPDHKSLRTSTSLQLPESQTMMVIPGEIRLIYGEQITSSVQLDDALANLILAEAGISEVDAPWLWAGLPLLLRESKDPAKIQSQYIPVLQDLLISGDIEPGPATAWASTNYLQERLGWTGLGLFINEVGQNCSQGKCVLDEGINDALINHLQLDSKSYDQMWQQYWSTRIEYAQSELDKVIAIRSDAISTNNKSAFLSSVSGEIPSLIQEEAHWFEDLDPGIKNTLTINAKPLAILPDGYILAKVTYTYLPNGTNTTEEAKTVSQMIRFSPGERGYQWSGPPIESVVGQHIQINYPSKAKDFAEELLIKFEEIYPSIAGTLGASDIETVYISLFTNQEGFSSSISLSMTEEDRITAWTAPGESIKLRIVGDRNIDGHMPALVDQVIRGYLLKQGVNIEWILQGLSTYISRQFDRGEVQKTLAASLPTLVERSDTIQLNAVEPIYHLTSEDAQFNQTVSWDAVKYLIETYGWEAILKLIQIQGNGNSFETAFIRSFGIDPDTFELEWKQSLANSHLLPNHIDIAQNFDQGKAMEHVVRLTDQEMAGRKAGSRGAVQAADYIASIFEENGLLPIGDQIQFEDRVDNQLSNMNATTNPDGLSSTPTITYSVNTSYYQTFPISYTENIPIPSLEFQEMDSQSISQYTHLGDFIALKPTVGANRSTRGELVWIGDENYQDTDIAGKIVLRIPLNDIGSEILEAANQGAEGIIFIGNKRDEADIMVKDSNQNFTNQGINIPVFELTQSGYTKLLESLGYDRLTIRKLPVGSSLDLLARLDYNIETPKTVFTTNVLGYLPGSDPHLKREFIVIGAHYDHVGDDANGRRYSGANDNASGVGVFLEIARLWHESGYKPKRSVLFAAWGAQELGQAGSHHFVQYPTVAIENIIGMLQLDGVGGGEGFNLGANGSWEQDGSLIFNLSAASISLDEKLIITLSSVESDHLSFHQADIPAVLIAWRLANEDNLPDSIAQAVHPSRLGESGRITSLTLMNLAR